jgi:hypothetical protein
MSTLAAHKRVITTPILKRKTHTGVPVRACVTDAQRAYSMLFDVKRSVTLMTHSKGETDINVIPIHKK